MTARHAFAWLVGLSLACPKAMAQPIDATGAMTTVGKPDGRLDLRLTPRGQAQFLSEMRVMLGSVQQIAEGLGSGDRAVIAEAARRSCDPMARATPACVQAKVRKAFEELAIRAENDDMDQLASHLGQTLKQYVACHATFKVH